jgi:hypothetical protein
LRGWVRGRILRMSGERRCDGEKIDLSMVGG